MLRVAVALLAVVFAVQGGILRKRLAADFPSGDDVISAFDEVRIGFDWGCYQFRCSSL